MEESLTPCWFDVVGYTLITIIISGFVLDVIRTSYTLWYRSEFESILKAIEKENNNEWKLIKKYIRSHKSKFPRFYVNWYTLYILGKLKKVLAICAIILFCILLLL